MTTPETPHDFVRAVLTAAANGINPADAFTLPDLMRFSQVDLLIEFVGIVTATLALAGVATGMSDHEALNKVYDLIREEEEGRRNGQ